MSYTVGRVARLAGVTVKTLHHYDRIGLLSSSGRSEAGYRLYEEPDIERLQRVLFYRELGLPLERISHVLKEPHADANAHLRRQRGLLVERIERLRRMVAAIDKELEAGKMDIKLTPEERLEVFGDFDPESHAEEAEERWGETEAYRQSQRRVSRYTKEDWLRIKAEAEEVESRLAELFQSGAASDSVEAMDAAEAHREHITRWFYRCGHEMHAGLGELYVNDERFRAYYDARVPGLSGFVREAIRANSRRSG